jgi:hypothetical protein
MDQHHRLSTFTYGLEGKIKTLLQATEELGMKKRFLCGRIT